MVVPAVSETQTAFIPPGVRTVRKKREILGKINAKTESKHHNGAVFRKEMKKVDFGPVC